MHLKNRISLLKFLCVVAVVTASTPFALAKPQQAVAQKQIVLLSPDQIPDLPEPVREGLTDNGCLIPQPPDYWDKPGNYFHANLDEKEGDDWVVLCSSAPESVVLVFWEGQKANPARLAAQRFGDARHPIPQLANLVREIKLLPGSEATKKSTSKAHDGIEERQGDSHTYWYLDHGTWSHWQ